MAAIVVDYEDLDCDRDILDVIVVWLSGEGGQRRTGTSKSLSLKGMEVEEDELRRAIIKLKSVSAKILLLRLSRDCAKRTKLKNRSSWRVVIRAPGYLTPTLKQTMTSTRDW